MRCRRSAIAAAAAAALVLAAPAAASGPRFSLGEFAGYVWRSGSVGSVSATFSVPRIRRGSPPSSIAATWIGAQATGVIAPFVQIGVNEVRARGRPDFYYAFWSDTALEFHPRFLFTVAPGDVVAASLHHLPSGWLLAIVDARTRTARRLTTTDESSGDFDLAEFLQEDPTSSDRRELPYPRLSGGWFRQLRIDGAPPARGTLLSQWMSNAHGDVAPTQLEGDAFALHPTKLSAAVARYLRVIAPADAALEDYDAEAAGWVVSTPRTAVGVTSAAVAGVLRANSRTLMSDRWPPRVRGALDTLVTRERALARVLDGAATAPDLLRWRLEYERSKRALTAAGRAVRARLHAPAFNA
jgi:Peptidase A4 family